MTAENVDWDVYRLQVLADLKRISKNVETLAESDTEIRVAIGKLQLCSAITGAVAGAAVTVIVTLLLHAVW